MSKGNRKWHLVMLVQFLLFLHGVEMQHPQAQQQPKPKFQQQQQRQNEPERKPQIYWATSVDNNRRFQQANEWNVVGQHNDVDRQWFAPAPAPNPPPAPNSTPATPTTTTPSPTPLYAPPPAPVYAPPPAPVYAPPPAPVYAPPPTPPPYHPYMPPAPPAYPDPAPPAYPDPAPPAYPEPAPPAYPDPAPPAYPEPAPPAYNPAPPAYNPGPPPTYDPSAPSYGPPQNPPGQYYYYVPVKESKDKGPSIKDMLEKDKEALVALMPGSDKNLSNEQKIWLSVLTPLIVVALVIPLTAILFSGFTVTTNGRKFGELNMTDMKKSILDIAEGYGSVLETDECMQRIICDLGSYAKSIPGKSYMLTFLSTLVPDTMQNNMAIFQKAATYGADKAQCSSFKCSAWKY